MTYYGVIEDLQRAINALFLLIGVWRLRCSRRLRIFFRQSGLSGFARLSTHHSDLLIYVATLIAFAYVGVAALRAELPQYYLYFLLGTYAIMWGFLFEEVHSRTRDYKRYLHAQLVLSLIRETKRCL